MNPNKYINKCGEDTSRDDTDLYPEPDVHTTECWDVNTTKQNAILEIIECDGCGEQHVQTRAYIDVMFLVFGIIATGAIFTERLFSSPEWTADTVIAVNSALAAGAGIGTILAGAKMTVPLEIDGDSR